MARLLIMLGLLITGPAMAGEIYKYKDENGNWAFSDKKPTHDSDVEVLPMAPADPRQGVLDFHVANREGQAALVVENPFYAPIELQLHFEGQAEPGAMQVIEPQASTVVYRQPERIPAFRYRWLLGQPNPRVVDYAYSLPVASPQTFEISQGFNGRFSHTQEPSRYAVDIAMQVGTTIAAARPGVVIQVKDDYHMGGRADFFLDKANYVSILHEDGTYAVYAHILQGSALVAPGDAVVVGDKLAMSGSSGYSTGPHLHFVIRKNAGFDTRSVPFVFQDASGNTFTPQKGMSVSVSR